MTEYDHIYKKLIPYAIFNKCQDTTYDVLDDMWRLWKVVRKFPDPNSKFLELVNRMVPFNNKEINDILSDRFHYELTSEIQNCGWKKIPNIIDSALEKFSKVKFPPPAWLRIFPVCCEIGCSNRIVKNAVLRWIALNVETPNIQRENRISYTVNINSNSKSYDKNGKVILENATANQKVHPISDLLFDLTKAVYGGGKPSDDDLPPYICWGVRFRTNLKGKHVDDNHTNPWLELVVDMDNAHANEDQEFFNKNVYSLEASPVAPRMLDTSIVKKIYENWINFPGQPVNGKSPQVAKYCLTLRHFYPNDKWPETGIDCLICPPIFWSLDKRHLGSAATIFWGFEGRLQDSECKMLLLLSHILLSGIGQFARIADLMDAAKYSGRIEILHQIPKDMAAHYDSFKDFSKRIDELRKEYPGISIPACPRRDSLSVDMMFLKAANERQLFEMPNDCAEILRDEWNNTTIEEFVNYVVWPQARQKVYAIPYVAYILNKPKYKNLSIDGIEKEFNRPQLSISEPFTLKNRIHKGLYPLALIVLRNAYEHAYTQTILDTGKPGQVIITHHEDDKEEKITISNSGKAPHEEKPKSPQNGFKMDVETFRGLTGGWIIDHEDNTDYCRYDSEEKLWKCTIIYLEKEKT